MGLKQNLSKCSQTRISHGFALIVDDTGHRKSGNFTSGVGRQYIGEIGKTDNGIVAVTTHLWQKFTGGLQRRWANRPLNTFTASYGSFSDSDVFSFLRLANQKHGRVCLPQSEFRLYLGLKFV